MEYENLGDSFTAYLTHDASGLGIYNAQSNVELGTANVPASEWKFIRQSDGSYKLLSVLDNKALDVAEAKTANHTNVQTYAGNDTAAQRWFIRKQGAGYILISACSGKALDVAQGTASSTAGTNVQIYDVNNSGSQIMRIIRSDGSTDYLSQCTVYPSYVTLSIQNSTTLKTLPCSAGTDSNSKDVITLSSGTVVAEGLYENTAGNYWYRVNYNGTTCYLYSGDATPTANYAGLSVNGITAPSSLNEGSAFGLAGTINSSVMPIHAVRAFINNASGAMVLYAYDLPGDNVYSYSLAGSTVDNGITFNTLPAGEYEYVLVAEVRNYRAVNNELSYVTCQETLNDSDFTVVGTAADTITITFDPNGGTCSETTRVINAGGTVTNLPVAIRSGYIFEGWATKLGLLVCEGDTVYVDYTFYAQWSTDYEDLGDSFTAYLTHDASGNGIVNAQSNVELGTPNTEASEWQFIRQSDGSYKILSVLDGKALDVYDAGTANWTNVWTYADNNTLAQRWYIREVEYGYILISACSGKALDVYYGSAYSAVGDNVQIYAVNNSDAQIMRITRSDEALNGWVEENGSWYYYQDGQKLTGWLTLGSNKYYLHSNGAMATGMTEIGGKYYFFSSGGAMQTGWQTVNGVRRYFGSDGAAVTQWVQDDGTWYYLSNGAKCIGWGKINGYWYYFDSNGAMQTGWQQINGKWYYFASGGAMQTGWLKDGSYWYYLDSTGAMTTGWVKVGSNWFYMNKSGVMQTGWQKINGYWYYFASGGAMQTGWVSIGGKWYYFASGGAMQTGWQQINGKWYYFASGGAMQTGWLYLDGYWYYLDATGAMVTGTQVIGGKTYIFNKSGVWIG